MIEEHRSFVRHPTDISIEILTDYHCGRAQTHLRNVSVGGLACESDVCLDQGTIVGVRIALVEPVFEAAGRVVWCRIQANAFEVGIQFVNPEDVFAARMVEQICQIEHYKKEVREKEGRHLSAEEAASEWIAKYAAEYPYFS
jgi:hypothetical protein